MSQPVERHVSMRKLCIALTVAQTVGFAVGVILLVGSFGICGPTQLFTLALPVLVVSSACHLANLLVWRQLRRNGEKDLERLAAWVWAVAPGVLATLVILLFFGRMWIHN
jgi:hypothetical protein